MSIHTAATGTVLDFPLHRVRPSTMRAPIPRIDNSVAIAACDALADRLMILSERAADFAAIALLAGDPYTANQAIERGVRLEEDAVDSYCYAGRLAEEDGQPVPTLLNWIQLTDQERQDATDAYHEYVYGDIEDAPIWFDLIKGGEAFPYAAAALAAR